MKDDDHRTNEADHAGKGTNHSLDNPSASTIPAQVTRKHSMGNSGRILSAKCESRNRLKDEYSVISDGKRIRTWPMQNSSRNVSSDSALRASEHPKAKQFREVQDQFFQRKDTRNDGNTMHPDAPQYSLNPRQTFPTREEWHYCKTDEEYTLFMKRQQLQIRNWPIQDSSRNAYSNYGPRLDMHTKVQNVNFMEDQHQFMQRRDTRSGGYLIKPSIQQSSLNTRQVYNAGYGWHYGMTDEEYNWIVSRQLLSMTPWPAPYSSRNAYFAFKPRESEHTEAQEKKSSGDQHQFFQCRGTRKFGGTVYPNSHHSSLNTRRQILPTRGGWHLMTEDERNLAVRDQQLRTTTLPVKGVDRNVYFNFGSRWCEYPKDQKIKSMDGQQKITQRGYTPRSCRATIGSRTDHISNTVTNLSEKDCWQNRMIEEYKLNMDRGQLRIKTQPMTDSSGNAYSGIESNIHKHPKVQEIKFKEDQNQFLQHRNTRSDENIIHPTNCTKYYPTSLNSGQTLPAGDGRQHHTTSQDYAVFVGGQQIRLEERNEKDSNRNAESKDGPRMCENSPKEQKINLHKGLRRRRMENKAMRYPNASPVNRTTKSPTDITDGYHTSEKTRVRDSKRTTEFANKTMIFKEPLDELLMDFNEISCSRYLLITRIAEDYWSLLLLITAIVLGALYFIP